MEQLGRGLTELNKFKEGASAPFETITKDISNVKALDERLHGMNETLRQSYNTAMGLGDKPGQINSANSVISPGRDGALVTPGLASGESDRIATSS